jgi:AmmeMemoRadiSam system protein A
MKTSRLSGLNSNMNQKMISRYLLVFVPLSVLFLGTLLLQSTIGRSESQSQIKPREHIKAAPSMTVWRENGKKEGKMAGADQLTEEQGKVLLKIARDTIEQELFGSREGKGPDLDLPSVFHERRGTFVTLTIGGNLRGCIGHIIPQESLIEGIRVNAINAAFRDPRFHPLTKEEWKRVKIEISILTDPEPLHYSDAEDLLKKLRPGIDGVIIKKDFYQSTFLPQVWEQLPDKEEFLAHLCLKAGLKGNAWRKKGLEVSTYQVQAFEE